MVTVRSSPKTPTKTTPTKRPPLTTTQDQETTPPHSIDNVMEFHADNNNLGFPCKSVNTKAHTGTHKQTLDDDRFKREI